MEFQRNIVQELNLSNLSGVETVEDVEDVEVPEKAFVIGSCDSDTLVVIGVGVPIGLQALNDESSAPGCGSDSYA